MSTTTISGTTDIDDGMLLALDTSWNCGTSTELYCSWLGGGNIQRALIRCKKASIPSGTITGFRLIIYCDTDSAIESVARTYAYRIKDANTWGEGTKNYDVAASGESCWAYAKYNTQSWAGSAGCGTSGTDYFATPAPYVDFPTTYGSRTYTLTNSWASDWRDSVVVDNGLLIRTAETSVGINKFHSTENTTPPTWEVDWSPAGVSAFISRRSPFNSRQIICR